MDVRVYGPPAGRGRLEAALGLVAAADIAATLTVAAAAVWHGIGPADAAGAGLGGSALDLLALSLCRFALAAFFLPVQAWCIRQAEPWTDGGRAPRRQSHHDHQHHSHQHSHDLQQEAGARRRVRYGAAVLGAAVLAGGYTVAKVAVGARQHRGPGLLALEAVSLAFATAEAILAALILRAARRHEGYCALAAAVRASAVHGSSINGEGAPANGDGNGHGHGKPSPGTGTGSKGEEEGEEEEGLDGPRKKHRGSYSIRRLIAMSSPDWPLLLSATLCLLVAAIANTAVPHFLGQAVDYAAISGRRDKFKRSLTLLSITVVLCSVFTGLRGAQFSLCIARLKVRLRSVLFQRIVAQEIGFFDTQKTGNLISRLIADSTKMGDAIGNNLNVFLRAVVQVITLLAFMFHLNWRLSLITSTLVPLVVVISRVFGRYLRDISKRVQKAVAKTTNVAEQVLSSMSTVRSFAAEDAEFQRFSDVLYHEFYRLAKLNAFVYLFYAILLTLLPNITTIAILAYGGHEILHDRLTGGTLVTFLFYQMNLSSAFGEIGYVFTSLSEAFGAADKVFELIDRPPRMLFDGQTEPAGCQGRIELRDVHFSYPSRPGAQILRGLNLTVEPGQVVALVGPSGGGKSSIVKLIERLYEPQEGRVLLDGVDVAELLPEYLHRAMSIVSQEPTLYARSIRDNIVFGLDEDDYAEEGIVQATRQANAHEFIARFPDGLDTQVGERGVTLSGGQKQRVAIARALVRNPKILLLDEATSALDAESEHIVQQAIDQVMQGRTVVVIAHRLSTVKHADQIAVIADGAVAELGTHAQLMALNGSYADLVRRQLSPPDEAPAPPAAT